MIIRNGKIYLSGDGSFPHFFVEIDGDDLVVRNAKTTNWGDSNDKMDSGKTASGKSTRDNPGAVWCSLPMDFHREPATKGSPLPVIPWGTPVHVWFHASQKEIVASLEDDGPGKRTGHLLDLTDGAWDAGEVDTAIGVTLTDYRVIGGVRFYATPVRAAIRAAQAELAR